jgi:hypothetical protein
LLLAGGGRWGTGNFLKSHRVWSRRRLCMTAQQAGAGSKAKRGATRQQTQ